MSKRPNWSQRLPRAIDVPGHMKVRTLADVGKFLVRLPPERQAHTQWQAVAGAALKAAD